MTEKVDVRNHVRSLGHRSKVDLEVYVESWVRSIFAVILERYAFFVRAEKLCFCAKNYVFGVKNDHLWPILNSGPNVHLNFLRGP